MRLRFYTRQRQRDRSTGAKGSVDAYCAPSSIPKTNPRSRHDDRLPVGLHPSSLPKPSPVCSCWPRQRLALVARQPAPWSNLYDGLLGTPFSVAIGEMALQKPLASMDQRWPDGDLLPDDRPRGPARDDRRLPGYLAPAHPCPFAAALGGMVVPAAIFIAINHGDPVAIDGWAVPVATDIAFALGILALAGDRVPGHPQDLPARPRHLRRSGCHHHHRPLLFARSLGDLPGVGRVDARGACW